MSQAKSTGPLLQRHSLKALIEIEVGECQIKVSTLDLFSVQLTPSSWSAIICVSFPIGSPKFLYVLNLDKCLLAHETIVNVKCGVLYWLRKGPRKSQLHHEKLFRVLLFPKFLRVSYFYERARTHEAILDGEIDLEAYTNGFYFPNLAKIRHAHGCMRNPVAFLYSL